MTNVATGLPFAFVVALEDWDLEDGLANSAFAEML